MDFPNLQTPRLSLTELTADDAGAIYDLFSSERVVEFYDLEVFTKLAQAEQLIKIFHSRFQESTGIRWAMRLNESNKLIGTCGFNSWNVKMRNCTIGYDLSPEYWGHGYASEAVRKIVESAFSGALPYGSLNRVQADTIPGNVASEKLLKRLGFREEGIRRQCGYWKNKFHDLKCFGLLKSEYAND